MPSFEQYRAGYEANWAKLRIRPAKDAEAGREAQRLLAGKNRYIEVQRRTGVPWWFVGLCHYRESHYNWNTYLGNGQALNKKTTIVPIGRGPFNSFEDGAVDALKLQGFAGATDWSIARVAYRLEGFNGFGYHGKGVPSPYLYGGSTVYGPPEAKAGKYVRDHVFDPNFVDSQLGTLVILKKLMETESSITLGMAAKESPQPDDGKPPKQAKQAAPAPSAVTPAQKTGGAIAAGGAVAAGVAAASGVDWYIVGAIFVGIALIGAVVFSIMRRD